MIGGPTPHLEWDELACSDGTPYPQEWKDRAQELAELFEMIRWTCGDRPLQVLSAYRTPEHNRRVGGVPKSQHLEGRALDLRPPEGMDSFSFFKIIKSMRLSGGIGFYRTFVHVDIRDVKRLVSWSGSSSFVG